MKKITLVLLLAFTISGCKGLAVKTVEPELIDVSKGVSQNIESVKYKFVWRFWGI